jgi:hypothetical protein
MQKSKAKKKQEINKSRYSHQAIIWRQALVRRWFYGGNFKSRGSESKVIDTVPERDIESDR